MTTTQKTWPVGHAWKSRFNSGARMHVLVNSDNEWRALCGRAQRCTYEYAGTLAAVTCQDCQVAAANG